MIIKLDYNTMLNWQVDWFTEHYNVFYKEVVQPSSYTINQEKDLFCKYLGDLGYCTWVDKFDIICTNITDQEVEEYIAKHLRTVE